MRRRTLALPLAVAAALIVPSLASAQGGSGGGRTASCDPLPTFQVTAGYAPSSTLGAVWTRLGITNCAPPGSFEDVRLSIVNTGTGLEEVAVDVPYAMTVDYDSAATSTTYRVTVTATDGLTGAVLGSKSATVTTPKAKDRVVT